MPTNTANMNLILPTIGSDSGLTWEQSMNANSLVVDNHNHSPGQGNQIQPSGLDINTNLTFNDNQATNLQAAVFTEQNSVTTLEAAYVKTDGNLYYNDGAGNNVQITSGGVVNATSSGITSGTNSASFVSNVLVVNEATNKPANIKGASLLIGNNTTNTKYLTLQPPNAMAADYSVTLPALPASTQFVTLDSSGNLSGAIATSGGLTGSNLGSNVNLSGKSVQVGSKNVISSNTNAATNGLSVIRGVVNGNTGNVQSGEGFSSVRSSTGVYVITYTTAFKTGDVPVVVGSPTNSQTMFGVTAQNENGFHCIVYDISSVVDVTFNFIVMGERA